MKQPDKNLVLDEALGKLQAGVPLDQVLAECGDCAAELAPLLGAARQLRQSVQPTVPHGAMARSRARFLQAAETRSARPAPSFRWAISLMMVVLGVAAALFFTGLGSASALPGQALYPIKRAVEQAQLALAADPSEKLLLEEHFDRRRVDETLRLIEQGRGQQVSFAGFLSTEGGQPWTVGGIPLELDEDQRAIAGNLAGAYVEVQGQVRPGGGVLVSVLQLRFFELKGELAQRAGESWFVGGVWVHIGDQTHLEQPLALGQRVGITAIRLSQQDYLALSVRLEADAEIKETEIKETEFIGPDSPEDGEDQTETPEGEVSDDETDDEADSERIETPAPSETDDDWGEDCEEPCPPDGEHDDLSTPDDLEEVESESAP